MKKVLTAGIVLAGVLAVSGTSFAEFREKFPESDNGKKSVAVQPARQRLPEPPDTFSAKRPPMSRDMRKPDDRPPVPPDDRHPRVSPDKKPPMPPRSVDKRPPMPPRSGDRRPPR